MIINKKYFKEYGILPLNYDLTEVMLYVPLAEKIWVLPILGEMMYDEIQEQVDNNTLSDENSTLLVKILWRYLTHCTILEALPIIWSHFTEVGLTKGKSDNSDSVSLKDLAYIEAKIRAQVEALKDELVKFLHDHYTSFPLWNGNCGCYNDCCNAAKGKLNKPNPYYQLYKPLQCDTRLK